MTGDLTAQIHQYLSTAPGSLFAQQPVEMLDEWEGDANLLWRVSVPAQQAVVKLFLDAGQARSRRQFDGHQLFAPSGLAPQPLWADRYPHGLSRQLIVYSWVDGEVIQPDDPSQLDAWAEAVANVHATPAESLSRFSPHPLNLDYYWRIEQGSIAQIEQWLTSNSLGLATYFHELAMATEQLVQRALPLWATTAPAPIHGDLSLDHTLSHRGQVTLLDWEMFGLGEPALDVARLLQHEAQSLTDVQVDRWLERYLTVVDQPQMAARIDLFQQLLDVHNVVYLLIGLQQNVSAQLGSELNAALPFMQVALTAAFERATVALELPVADDPQPIVADFVSWLCDATSTAAANAATSQ
jgi:thiamine kinase-like enzyme